MLSRYYDSLGHDLITVGRNQKKLNSLKKEISKKNQKNSYALDFKSKINYEKFLQILKKNEKIIIGKEIIIINSFGILQEYFKCAKSVFIGKSLIKKLENDGGQNPIDAAKLGCKIYHGPYVYNFKEIYNILNKKKISKKVKNIKDLSSNLIKDLKNVKKKQDQITKGFNNLGKKTLIATMKDINNFISNEI